MFSMMLWRWDDETVQWQSHRLQPGTLFALGLLATLVPVRDRACGLLAKDEVVVNGLPVFPLRVLKDRDEICAGGQTVYFSYESPAELVPFIAETKDIFCGRCKGKMGEGDLSVQCPRCGAWHHQKDGLSCWAYDSRCSSGCDQPTTGLSWQPEPLRSCRSGGHGKQNG